MALKWFLESTTHPGISFEIVKLDKSTMRATLMGDTGVAFDQEVTQEKLDKYHYRIVRKEVDADAAPVPDAQETA